VRTGYSNDPNSVFNTVLSSDDRSRGPPLVVEPTPGQRQRARTGTIEPPPRSEAVRHRTKTQALRIRTASEAVRPTQVPMVVQQGKKSEDTQRVTNSAVFQRSAKPEVVQQDPWVTNPPPSRSPSPGGHRSQTLMLWMPQHLHAESASVDCSNLVVFTIRQTLHPMPRSSMRVDWHNVTPSTAFGTMIRHIILSCGRSLMF